MSEEEEEKEGIEAIIFLQSMVGVTETEEQAKAGWNKMSENEKMSTMSAYGMLNGTAN